MAFDAANIYNLKAPYDIVRKMRASILVLDPFSGVLHQKSCESNLQDYLRLLYCFCCCYGRAECCAGTAGAITQRASACLPHRPFDFVGRSMLCHGGTLSAVLHLSLAAIMAKIMINPLVASLLSNRLRKKLGTMFEDPETTPGGEAMKFFAHIRMESSSGKGTW